VNGYILLMQINLFTVSHHVKNLVSLIMAKTPVKKAAVATPAKAVSATAPMEKVEQPEVSNKVQPQEVRAK
jgi:hypothetical protein